MPGKNNIFERMSILFHPQKKNLVGFRVLTLVDNNLKIGGGAGYRPRVHNIYYIERLSP